MKLGLISGSHRKTSQSGKVARYTQKEIEKLGHETYLLDLAHNPLPFWDDGMWSKEPTITAAWRPVSAALSQCDGFVVVSPEWGGMVPSGLKNLFLFCSDGCMYHKPGLIVGVSASRGGAYPVAELRMSSYKNVHIVYTPEHVIVRNAEKVLNTEASQSDEDAFTRKRLDYGIKSLIEYSKALKQVRDSGVLNRKDFANGM